MNVQRVSEFVAGLLFGIGLIVSGMTDPAKVIGFLDLIGPWDPSLAFVMGGGVAVGAIAFAFSRTRATAFFGGAIRLPAARDIDARLVAGSLVFGIGWGLAGFCPGPALVAVGMGIPKAFAFVLAMLAGMAVQQALDARRAAATPA